MQRQMLIAKAGVNYAASKSSATAETATTLNDLAEGALGLFYRDSNGEFQLVESGTPSTLSIGTAPELLIAIGEADGYVACRALVPGIGLQIYNGKSYLAPVAQVIHLGYNGTTGDGMGTPANSTAYGVNLVKKTTTTFPKYPRFSSYYKTAASGNTAYSLAAGTVNDINGKADASFPMLATIIGNGTSTAVTAGTTGSAVILDTAGAGTVLGSVTNGSRTLTFTIQSAATTFSASGQVVAVGDFVKIASDIYKITALDYTTSSAAFVITLDRDFTGTTLSTAAASNFHLYSVAPTTFGIKLTADTAGEKFEVAMQGGYEGVDVFYTTAPHYGSGTYTEVAAAERDASFESAYYHEGQAFVETPRKYAVSSETYDIITLSWLQGGEDKSGQGRVVGHSHTCQIAIPASLSGGGNFITYLNTWAATAPKTFPSVSV